MTATANPVETQSPATLLFPDLNGELATTRRILERVPDGKDEWRPHEKSSQIAALATHLAQLPSLGIVILTTDEFDVSSRPPQPKITNNADRLQVFDEYAGKFKDMVENLTWDQAMANWRFRWGEKVINQGPRAILMRAMVLTHSTHHRAQLGVYLRLLGIPVPGSYGPSADEPFQA